MESRGEGGTTTSSTSGGLMNPRGCAMNFYYPSGIAAGMERTPGFCIESGVGGTGGRQGASGGFGVVGRSKQVKRKEEKSQEFTRPPQYLHQRYPSAGAGGGGEGAPEVRAGMERGHEDPADGDDEPRAKSAAVCLHSNFLFLQGVCV